MGESDNDKIIGGEEAEPHSYPFAVAITLEGLCCCGGSILGMRVLNLSHIYSCRKVPQIAKELPLGGTISLINGA